MYTQTYTLRARGQKGQTLVEFALVVALLLAIIFGIVEFGRLWFYSNHLNNSVRAAARYAAVLGSTPGGYSEGAVETYLTNEIAKTMDPAQIASPNGITVSPATTPDRGDNITVTVTYNFQVLSGGIIPFFNGQYQLVRSATMRYEG